MARRIVAALVAVLAILLLTPDRLSGEPTTTTTPSVAKLLHLPNDSAPNPLHLHPRRPGAKYEDVEALPSKAVALLGSWIRPISWTVEPRNALPDRSAPGNAANDEKLGLVDGYSRRSTNTTGSILRVVVRVTSSVISPNVTCVATTAGSGTVLVPFATPPRPGPKLSSSEKRTSVNLVLYLPLGSHHGRVYLTCRNAIDAADQLFFTSDGRAVWALDV